MDSIEKFEQVARRAARKVTPWIVRLGRFGIAAKGTVYVIVGWLALLSVIRGNEGLVDQQGALHSVLRQRFGRVMLTILAAGLFSYMLWRFAEALLNPQREQHNLKGYFKRFFRFTSGIAYGGLGLAAAKLLAGLHAHRSGPRDWTALVMIEPEGRFAVVVAGLVTAGFGLYGIYKSSTGQLKGQLVLDRYGDAVRGCILLIGRLGQAARGIIFTVIGVFVAAAGLHANPNEAKGVAEALMYIQHEPLGSLLLAMIAVGLISYGTFQFFEAAYRRIA